MNRRPLSAAFLGLALLAPLLHPSSASAALFVPPKTTDGADGACDADCSLREAVVAANANAGADVILLGAGVYTLTLPGTEDGAVAGDLDILGDLVLAGDGAGQSIVDGGLLDRVLDVADGIPVEVRDVTLRAGRSQGPGGAIANSGDLTLRRVLVSSNVSRAGAGEPARGGGIWSGLDGRLEVVDSAVSLNLAEGGSGGGVFAGGEVVLTNVTIVGNNADGAGSGGGVYLLASAEATLVNVTVAANSAGGNGGGILAESTAFTGAAPVVANSLVATNHAATHDDCSGPINSSYNLIGNGTGCAGPSAASHDLVGTAALPIDPKLGPFGENGGPTPTYPLLPVSPAVDLGNPAATGSGGTACAATDQRGAGRPGGPHCDVGAFELTTACVPGGAFLCLGGGRFAVSATFQTATSGITGQAHAVTLTPDSGYFWFFNPANVEVTVKQLNGCAVNNRHWVFAAGMTNLRVDLRVTDTKTGTTKTYTNPLNRVYRTILDTNAFNTCP
jgi:CSLREA domain-containing protein